MIKQKWVVFQETKNFRTFIPLKLAKKIDRRAKLGKSTTINPKLIRIETKDAKAISGLLDKVVAIWGEPEEEIKLAGGEKDD